MPLRHAAFSLLILFLAMPATAAHRHTGQLFHYWLPFRLPPAAAAPPFSLSFTPPPSPIFREIDFLHFAISLLIRFAVSFAFAIDYFHACRLSFLFDISLRLIRHYIFFHYSFLSFSLYIAIVAAAATPFHAITFSSYAFAITADSFHIRWFSLHYFAAIDAFCSSLPLRHYAIILLILLPDFHYYAIIDIITPFIIVFAIFD